MKDADIKKYIKQVRNEANKDMKNHIGALMEEVNDRFKATGEGMTHINERLNKMERTLNSHTEQIGSILTNTAEIKSRLNKIELDVSLELDKKVDKKLFVDLNNRVRVLEKKK